MEPLGELVQALPPGAVQPRGGVGLAPCEAHLARQQQLPAAQQPPPGLVVLRTQHLIPGPAQVDPPHPAGAPPEAGPARAHHRRVVMPGTPAPGFPLVEAHVEGATLRGALVGVPPGHVEELARLRGNGEGGLQVQHLVDVLREVGHGCPHPQQPTREQLELRRHLELPRGVGGHGPQPHRTLGPVRPRRGAGVVDRGGDVVERHRPRPARPRAQEARAAEPPGRVLRENGHPLLGGDGAVDVGHGKRVGQAVGVREVTEVRSPVQHGGQGGGVEAEHQARAATAQMDNRHGISSWGQRGIRINASPHHGGSSGGPASRRDGRVA